ncbi:hypothetical protein DY000_02055197 [Brassica cretica]|uniref:Uncharacterized protein n=1 Tax=Brassica cretica TaxID=69181 RepID=A0ABQ7AJ68_BRACR|nr:hypothetical protein DY000_02055197 [Brassica cretica]
MCLRKTKALIGRALAVAVFCRNSILQELIYGGFGRFTITHLTRMVSSTLRSGGNAHSGRIFSIGSLPCMALLPLLPFADLHLNPRKFSSDSFNASSKPGLATPGLHHPSNHLKKMAVSERSSKPGLATPGLHHPFNHLNKMAVCKRSSSSSSLSPIHPRNGFCNANSTFYSKRNPLPLPAKFLP